MVGACIDAAEIHLVATLAQGQLDGPPPEQVHDAGVRVPRAKLRGLIFF